MPHEEATALVRSESHAIAAHSQLPHNEPALSDALHGSTWILYRHFGDAMIRHNATWLTGGVIGFISFLSSFFFTSTKIPPVAMAILSFILIGKAFYNAWREQYYKAQNSDNEARRLARQVHELENPQARVEIDSIIVSMDIDRNSTSDEWIWSTTLVLRIIPGVHAPLALSSASEVIITTNTPDFHIPVPARFDIVWHEGESTATPIDIVQAGRYSCEARARATGWGGRLPDYVKAFITLRDMRSAWRAGFEVRLQREEGAQARWLALNPDG